MHPLGSSSVHASRRPVVVRLLTSSEVVTRGVAAMLEQHADRVRLTTGGDPDVTLHEAWYAESLAALLSSTAFLDATNPVVLSPHREVAAVRAAVAAGARGYLSPCLDSERLVAALERVRDGDLVVDAYESGRSAPVGVDALTARERQVLLLVGEGLSNQDIATALYLTVNTVKSYVRSAYRKAGVNGRVAAVLWAVENRQRLDALSRADTSRADASRADSR